MGLVWSDIGDNEKALEFFIKGGIDISDYD
jgi:hypothetical protein